MYQPSEQPKKEIDRLRWGAFIIGCCAFAFQLFVLYPWHIELSNELKQVAALVKKSLKA